MQQDMTTGFYTISVLEGGEGALDPLSTATMEQVRIVRIKRPRALKSLHGGVDCVSGYLSLMRASATRRSASIAGCVDSSALCFVSIDGYCF